MKTIEIVKKNFKNYKKDIYQLIKLNTKLIDVLSYTFWITAFTGSYIRTNKIIYLVLDIIVLLGIPYLKKDIFNLFLNLKKWFKNESVNSEFKNYLLTIPALSVGFFQIYSFIKFYEYMDGFNIFMMLFWFSNLGLYYYVIKEEKNKIKKENEERIKKFKDNNSEFLFTLIQSDNLLNVKK